MANTRRKVCVVLVDRANYGRLKPVMRAIADHDGLELQVLGGGTMVLERFGAPLGVVAADGFAIAGRAYVELEGSTPVTMAKSVGLSVMEFANEFVRLAPDIVLLIGDRYEAFGAAIAAAYMNLCLVHLQGGEVSGSIDESARHAISKLAHFHAPSTARSAEYLVRMGEDPRTVISIGCPSSDIAFGLDLALEPRDFEAHGAGARIDLAKPYQLVVFHPTTTEWGDEVRQIDALLAALERVPRPTLLLWPNIDAGSDHISKRIRSFRQRVGSAWLRTLTNLAPEDYLRVLARAACAIGNSSSFVRDAGYFGTPVVLVGNRQEGREHDAHARSCGIDAGAIETAIAERLARGRFPPSRLYGDGQVSARIAKALGELVPYAQKRLHYIHEGGAH